jgi:hypothetical protein
MKQSPALLRDALVVELVVGSTDDDDPVLIYRVVDDDGHMYYMRPDSSALKWRYLVDN